MTMVRWCAGGSAAVDVDGVLLLVCWTLPSTSSPSPAALRGLRMVFMVS